MDFNTSFHGQFGKLHPPQSTVCPVAATTVGMDEQASCVWKSDRAYFLQPSAYALHSKLAGICACAEIDETYIIVEQVYTVGANFPQFRDSEVVVIRQPWVFRLAVFPPVVFEVADVVE